MAESFKETKDAFAIHRGRVWVSQLNLPDSPMYQERYRGRSILKFAGVDQLELNVAEARALRDWLTSVLPESEKAGMP
ncbi:MAG: hypothetical protein WB992_04795 [Bryobacteraceae bacterium]